MNTLTFIREIPSDKITDQMVKDYENRGFVLKWLDDSLEIWAN